MNIRSKILATVGMTLIVDSMATAVLASDVKNNATADVAVTIDPNTNGAVTVFISGEPFQN